MFNISFANIEGSYTVIKLELYRIFREVAQTGNFSRAAQNLFISQSAVSQSIRQLEDSLQTRLFLRTPRGVALTDDGHLLFDYVRSALGLLETGEDKLAQTRALQMGSLVIGASDTVTRHFLLPHLESFHRRYPNIHLQIISGRSGKALGLLRSGKVDVAFASSPEESETLRHIPCLETHMSFVASAGYPCDFDHVYSPAELAAFPLILLDRKASSRVHLEKFFLRHGTAIKPELESGAHSLLVDLARIGMGVAAGFFFSDYSYVAMFGFASTVAGFILFRMWFLNRDTLKGFNALLDLYDALDGEGCLDETATPVYDCMQKLCDKYRDNESSASMMTDLSLLIDSLIVLDNDKVNTFLLSSKYFSQFVTE